MAELAELEQEDLEESMKNMGGLPSVPTSKLPSTRPSHRTSMHLCSLLDHAERIAESITNGIFFFLNSTATKKRVEDEDDMKMLAAWAS